ncbi:integrase, catalytic region, zinc finger, CCHC-type containing protein [Tanacetum coccineum]
MPLFKMVRNTRNTTTNETKVIRCYNCKGEGHIAKQYDIDAFDSDCDEAPKASVVFMENLTSYDSYVLSEVPNYDTYQDNTVCDQSVQEMQYFKQPFFVNDSNIEITSDNNGISYDQYLKENKNEVAQDTTSPEQQDVMIMFVIDEMSNQVAKCNAIN